MTQSHVQPSASSKVDLKGSNFSLSVLHLGSSSVEECVSFLKGKVDASPNLFRSAPVVINIEKSDPALIDFEMLNQGIREAGMFPVGVSGCERDENLYQKIRESGLAIMYQSKLKAKPKAVPSDAAPQDTSATLEAESEITSQDVEAFNNKPARIIKHPVRSGQQVYAKGCDLIVLNHVSEGAEVMADGSIQIHGCCRGRVIAGAKGQTDASVIFHDQRSELVSIAGQYLLSDQIDNEFKQKKVILTLIDNKLTFETLTI